MDYEVGQKVRCIEIGDTTFIKKGEKYTIAKLIQDGKFVELKEIERPHSYYSDYFEPAGPKYKKGDTVRVVGDGRIGHAIKIGTLLTIEAVRGNGDGYVSYTIIESGQVVWEQDLKLVEDTNKIEIEKEDVMGEGCQEMTRSEQADHKDKRVQELEEQIAVLKTASKNLRAYKTDRDETIAQIMSKYDCKKGKAEDILALHEKGIK